MAIKKARKKAKTRTRKAAAKRPVKKRTVKKTAAKKAAKKRPARKPAKKKSTAKRTTAKRSPAKKRTASRARTIAKKPTFVEPGPPAGSIPPVEEPSQHAEAIGIVTHYYSHLGVAIVQVNKGKLRTGDSIHVKGHTTDFSQPVSSMEYEHQHIDEARAGQSVGIKVIDHAREHDIVYLEK